MRLTRNSAVHFSNKAATRFTSNSRWPRLKNSEHAQSMEVIVGMVMGQKVVWPKSGPAKTGPAVPLATPMMTYTLTKIGIDRRGLVPPLPQCLQENPP